MKRIWSYCYLILVLCIAVTTFSYGQGCSDAGFCSAANLKATAGHDTSNFSFVAIKATYGKGEQNVNIFQVAPELEWNLFRRNGIQVMIPWVITTGNLGNTSGLGDLLVAWTFKSLPGKQFGWSLSAGGKFPTGKTNISEKGKNYSLPMPYQTGLGTYDLILGAAGTFRNWKAAVGYQGVLKDENRNSFLHVADAGEPELNYFQSNRLHRGDDVLLRVVRTVTLREIIVNPGLLAIYRINKDRINDISGHETELKGSDELTLNITISTVIPVGKKFTLAAEAGTPLIVRQTRADGLTRSFVFSFSLQYKFQQL